MLEKFDGSGRIPRPEQVTVLSWLKEHWDKKVLAMCLPTGVGKSAILKSILDKYERSYGIIPSNALLKDSYIERYPTLNYLMGIDNYKCNNSVDMTCGDKKGLKHNPCKGCPYISSKARAYKESTIFNPISYYFYTRTMNFEPPDILVIDEAHKLASTLMLLVDISFRKEEFKYPNIETPLEMLDWLGSTAIKLKIQAQRYSNSGQQKKAAKLKAKQERIEFVLKAFSSNPEEFVFYEQEASYRNTKAMYLRLVPLKPPSWLLRNILKAKKIILMSATLMASDLWELGLRSDQFLSLPSPIPKENREILYQPNTVPMNSSTPPEKVAQYLEKQLETHKDINTVIHVSYSWANKLKPFFPEAFFNTSETKEQILSEFKQKGGVWFASGCAEGIDLIGDLCRLTIIPFLMYGNPKDPVIQKQLTMPKGRMLYDMKTLKTVIQQIGRGTRGVDDYSTTIIGDSKFPELILKNKKHLPISFIDAIVWRK